MKYLLAIAIATSLIIDIASGGWFGKSKKQKNEEDYELTCRHYQRYVFDMRFWGEITPQTFMEWAQFLNEAYLSNKFTDQDYNKMLLASWLELPQLAKCTQNNYEKFELARSRASVFRNALAYVKWQLDLFEEKCLDWAYQRLHRPPEGSTAEGGPWPTTPAG